jgi:surface antigen
VPACALSLYSDPGLCGDLRFREFLAGESGRYVRKPTDGMALQAFQWLSYSYNQALGRQKVNVMTSLKLLTSVLLLSSAALLMNGCATREQTGRVLGGAAGAAAGTQVGDGTGRTIATVGGAIIGAVVGGAIGRRMDDNDLRQTGYALENSETGRTTQWVNPDTGYRYEVRPTGTYQSASGQPCRNYTMDALIDGRNETTNGTACRTTDGIWQ